MVWMNLQDNKYLLDKIEDLMSFDKGNRTPQDIYIELKKLES